LQKDFKMTALHPLDIPDSGVQSKIFNILKFSKNAFIFEHFKSFQLE